MLSVHAASEELQHALAHVLLALGGTAVQVEGDTLTTYLRAPTDPEELIERAAHRLAAVAGDEALAAFSWRREADQDWAREWRRGLRPRRVGRFVVTPSWCAHEAESTEHTIVVDPEMAFGTGEHATTRGALRLLGESVRPADLVLDVGTGSGILAIAAALLGAGRVLAVESDADALENAADNLRRNGVADRVELRHALVTPSFLARAVADERPFDLIAANVLSSVLRPLLASFHAALAPGGRLILGGILEEEADDMLDAARAAGFTLLVEDLEAEWWGALFARGT